MEKDKIIEYLEDRFKENIRIYRELKPINPYNAQVYMGRILECFKYLEILMPDKYKDYNLNSIDEGLASNVFLPTT